MRVVVKGEVDLSSSRAFEADLGEFVDTGRAVELDLSGLEFIDSTGLRSVIVLQHRARDHGSTLRVVAVSPFIARVVRVAGLDERIFG